MNSDEELAKFNEQFIGLQSEVIKMQYKKYYSEIIGKKLARQEFAGTPLQEVYNEAMSLRRSDQEGQFYFITICPYPDTNIKDFIKVMDKVLKKKWIENYVYVYEQRQDDPDGIFYGIHTHMIVQRNGIAKSDVIREVYNTCKNIVGSKQSIDVKLIKTQHDLDVNINYILGQKSTEEKRKKQIVDKIFREKNSLQSYYEKNFSQYIVGQDAT